MLENLHEIADKTSFKVFYKNMEYRYQIESERKRESERDMHAGKIRQFERTEIFEYLEEWTLLNRLVKEEKSFKYICVV